MLGIKFGTKLGIMDEGTFVHEELEREITDCQSFTDEPPPGRHVLAGKTGWRDKAGWLGAEGGKGGHYESIESISVSIPRGDALPRACRDAKNPDNPRRTLATFDHPGDL